MEENAIKEEMEHQKRKTSAKIGKEDAGARVLAFLAGKFTYLPESEWKRYVEEKRVFLNGENARADDVLVAGDFLETVFPPLPEPPVDKRFEILYEDDALIAVNKPGNLPCHPAGRYFRHTLWHLLREERNRSGLFFVHRLDRETSGVVIVAKSSAAADKLGMQFQTRLVEKRYLALVSGSFPMEKVVASGYLTRDTKSVVRKKRLFVPGDRNEMKEKEAKWCATHLKGIGGGNGISLVEAVPETGRPHQIRATLLALGFPIVGDKLYGPDETIFLRLIDDSMTDEDRRVLKLDRQALHAGEVKIRHPETERRMTFKAAAPGGWEGLLADFEFD